MPKKKPKPQKTVTGTSTPQRPIPEDDFSLETQDAPKGVPSKSPAHAGARNVTSGGKKSDQPEVLSYRHSDKRKNNPEVGMVKPGNDPDDHEERWCYDPHIDPAPYLNWTGKAERTTFDVETVSLHVHERIDPASILAAVRKRMGERRSPDAGAKRRNLGSTVPDSAALHPGYAHQPDLFAAPFENLPLRDAIDFYKHERGWTNRLIAGDSLLQKESLAGQVRSDIRSAT